jgi:hypothetical protein
MACEEHDEARRVWRLTHPRTQFSLEMQDIQEFGDWFQDKFETPEMEEMRDEFLRAIHSRLSVAPKCYRHMYVNGSHYQTILYNANLPNTKDCVVTTTFAQQSIASTMDPNPVGDELCYVGYITNIISARY